MILLARRRLLLRRSTRALAADLVNLLLGSYFDNINQGTVSVLSRGHRTVGQPGLTEMGLILQIMPTVLLIFGA